MLNVESKPDGRGRTFLRCEIMVQRMEMVRAEVREPIDVISNRIEVPEEEEFDVEQLLLVASRICG